MHGLPLVPALMLALAVASVAAPLRGSAEHDSSEKRKSVELRVESARAHGSDFDSTSRGPVTTGINAVSGKDNVTAPKGKALIPGNLPFIVDWQDNDEASRAAGAEVIDALLSLKNAFPALFVPGILRKVVFASKKRGVSTAIYCREPTRSKKGGEDVTACMAGESRAVVVDIPSITSVKGRVDGGFYKDGAAMKAVLFHELLHGYSEDNASLRSRYDEDISDGRRTIFNRTKTRLFKPLWKIERWMEGPRLRAAMGEMTRDELLADAKTESERRWNRKIWRKYHDAWTLDEAKALVEKNQARYDQTSESLESKQVALAQSRNLPRRTPNDIHAAANDSEWFSYGGEIYFFAKDPAGLLTPAEMDFWMAVGECLRSPGVCAVPSPKSSND